MNLELLHVRTRGVDVFSTHLAPPPEQAYHRVTQVLAIDDSDPRARIGGLSVAANSVWRLQRRTKLR